MRHGRDRIFDCVASALASETVLALTAFALPALLMGALFSHLSTRAVQGGIAFSRALAFNTVGAAAAPLVFGVVLVPLYGAKVAFLLVAAGYWLLASRVAWRSAPALLTAATAAALALLAPPLVFVDVPEGVPMEAQHHVLTNSTFGPPSTMVFQPLLKLAVSAQLAGVPTMSPGRSTPKK